MRTADCFRSRCACASGWQSSNRPAASKPARIDLLIFIRFNHLKIIRFISQYPYNLPGREPPSRHSQVLTPGDVTKAPPLPPRHCTTIASQQLYHCTKSPLPLRPFILSAFTLYLRPQCNGASVTVQAIPRCRPCSPPCFLLYPSRQASSPAVQTTLGRHPSLPFTLHATDPR